MGKNKKDNKQAGMESASALKKKEKRFAIFLVLPAVILIGGMYLYPAIATILFSFAKIDITTLSITEFVGLQNYKDLLSTDTFQMTIGRTIYFAVMIVVITMLISFVIATVLNKKFVGRNALRTLVLLPWAIPPVVSGVLWGQMFHAEAGIINAFLYQLGITDGNTIWLSNPSVALHIVIIAEVWRFLPFATLFILAGMQNIPKPLYDAISMDGAGPIKRFTKITLPLAMPVMFPVIVVQFTMAMKSFDTIFVLTRGMSGTETLNYYVYQEAFSYFDYGHASAAAYILMLVMIVCIGVFFILQKGLLEGAVFKRDKRMNKTGGTVK